MPCPAKAAQRCPRALQSPAQGCQQSWHMILAASLCLGVPSLCAGGAAAACCSMRRVRRVTPGAAQGCLLPAAVAAAPLPSSGPWQGGLALPCGRVHLKPLEEDTRAGTDKDTSGQPLVSHPPVTAGALPLPRLSHATPPQQALGPGTLQLPAAAGSWSPWVPPWHQPHLGHQPL